MQRSDTSGQGLEPGDRFEVHSAGPGDQLRLPTLLGPSGFPVERIEDPAGRPLVHSWAAASPVVRVRGLGRLIPAPGALTWLEYQGSGAFRLVVGPGQEATDGTELTTEQGIRVALDPADAELVRAGAGGRSTSRRSTSPFGPLAWRCTRGSTA